jgi:hypothetical protein
MDVKKIAKTTISVQRIDEDAIDNFAGQLK